MKLTRNYLLISILFILFIFTACDEAPLAPEENPYQFRFEPLALVLGNAFYTYHESNGFHVTVGIVEQSSVSLEFERGFNAIVLETDERLIEPGNWAQPTYFYVFALDEENNLVKAQKWGIDYDVPELILIHESMGGGWIGNHVVKFGVVAPPVPVIDNEGTVLTPGAWYLEPIL